MDVWAHMSTHTHTQTLPQHTQFVQQLTVAHIVDFKATPSPRNKPFFTRPMHLKYPPIPVPSRSVPSISTPSRNRGLILDILVFPAEPNLFQGSR